MSALVGWLLAMVGLLMMSQPRQTFPAGFLLGTLTAVVGLMLLIGSPILRY